LRIVPYLVCCCLLFSCLCAQAQKKSAIITGKVLTDNDAPLARASVLVLGRQTGILTSDSGTFRIRVPAEAAFALVFSHAGYQSLQRNFFLSNQEEEQVLIRLAVDVKQLQTVTVTNPHDRQEAGLVRINPKDAINLPGPTGGIEGLIKVIVGSNNELTSQYSVRGGNYDENLIYVNDFEIFRPYLVSNAQQEGLSFINPEMTRNVSFYTGGFQAKYGDKMSSVLDIQYKKPQHFEGSAYIGLLEQGLQLGGADVKQKWTYLVAVRNRTNKSLLGSQETKGNYVPSSADLQASLGYQINASNAVELLAISSQTKFSLVPQYSELSAAVFSPFFTSNLALDTYFSGQEKDSYRTNLLGLTWNQQINPRLRIKWLVSMFQDKEHESQDIAGTYLFGERDFDKNSSSYGLITNPLGAGLYQTYDRNNLNITVWNATHKGFLDLGRHFIQWGISAEKQQVSSSLLSWELQDSAGYSLPFMADSLPLYSYIHGQQDLDIFRTTGFIQDNIAWRDSSEFTLQAGLRYNYNSLNKQWLLSPRIGFSFKPRHEKKDIIYRAALGIYDQPPFFRERIAPDGTINTQLRAQKSWQLTAGLDYNFLMGDRPFRFTTEGYFKSMTDVVPYDISNVHIQYDAVNHARAYAAGIDMRLFGELVKDAESWISLGLLHSMEKINDAFYYNYTLDSLNKPVDSVRVQQGWVRRPSDRLLTLGMFIQDYLSTNKNFKVYMNLLYGSNMPFNIPGSVKYRNALIIDPYMRVDLGFSALLLDSEKSRRRSHSPFRNFENIWATLEVFNVIDRENTISYLLIKDFSNTIYAIPQRLTPRLLNLKLIARF